MAMVVDAVFAVDDDFVRIFGAALVAGSQRFCVFVVATQSRAWSRTLRGHRSRVGRMLQAPRPAGVMRPRALPSRRDSSRRRRRPSAMRSNESLVKLCQASGARTGLMLLLFLMIPMRARAQLLLTRRRSAVCCGRRQHNPHTRLGRAPTPAVAGNGLCDSRGAERGQREE